MSFWNTLLQDESGMVLSAEAVLVGTLGVVGVTAGLSAAARSMNDELGEVALAFRSLDQSYSIPEVRGAHAWTAGSSFTQTPVEESRRQLREQMERDQKQFKQDRKSAEASAEEFFQLPLRGESPSL